MSSACVPSLPGILPGTEIHTIVRDPDFMGPQLVGKLITYLRFFLGTHQLSVILGFYLFSPAKRVAFIFPIW